MVCADGTLCTGRGVHREEEKSNELKIPYTGGRFRSAVRLRAYYGRVDELVRDAMSEKGVWIISIENLLRSLPPLSKQGTMRMACAAYEKSK